MELSTSSADLVQLIAIKLFSCIAGPTATPAMRGRHLRMQLATQETKDPHICFPIWGEFSTGLSVLGTEISPHI